MSGFRPASKRQAKLRMALIGPSGSGKTYTALAVAKGLGGRVAVVDTERGSASKYADLFAFDVLELDTFAPDRYIAAIGDAVKAGYDVLVIDSLSHAWAGKGGILEFVDARKRENRGDSFRVWGEATPRQNALVDAILGANIHVIATMRSKMSYVQTQDDHGKTVIRKVGMEPVQRDGLEYEFDIVGDLDDTNTLRITKSRAVGLSGQVIEMPGVELAKELRDWLGDGAPTVEQGASESEPERETAHAGTPAERAPEASAADSASPPTADALDSGAAQELGLPADDEAAVDWWNALAGLMDDANLRPADMARLIRPRPWNCSNALAYCREKGLSADELVERAEMARDAMEVK